MLCKECYKRDTCTKLCFDAEVYVNQDEVKYGDILLMDIDMLTNENILWDFSKDSDEKDEKYIQYKNRWMIYKLYYLDNRSTDYISKEINYTVQHIRRVLNHFRNIGEVTDKQYNILRLHFIDRISIVDIVKKLNIDERHIRRTIINHITNKIKLE
jgi:hypothetical protein